MSPAVTLTGPELDAAHNLAPAARARWTKEQAARFKCSERAIRYQLMNHARRQAAAPAPAPAPAPAAPVAGTTTAPPAATPTPSRAGPDAADRARVAIGEAPKPKADAKVGLTGPQLVELANSVTGIISVLVSASLGVDCPDPAGLTDRERKALEANSEPAARVIGRWVDNTDTLMTVAFVGTFALAVGGRYKTIKAAAADKKRGGTLDKGDGNAARPVPSKVKDSVDPFAKPTTGPGSM